MFRVRNIGLEINPFILNPVKAIYKGENVGISHIVKHDSLWLGVNLPDGKYTMAEASTVELLNKHELERIKMLLNYLKIEVK